MEYTKSSDRNIFNKEYLKTFTQEATKGNAPSKPGNK